jgi:hypothetical protein
VINNNFEKELNNTVFSTGFIVVKKFPGFVGEKYLDNLVANPSDIF